MYRRLCLISFCLFLVFVGIVNAEIDRSAAYDAEFWKNIDDRLQKINPNGICVLPFEDGNYIFETEPYRNLIESRLIKLHDRAYRVVCRNFDDIKSILDNWELETSVLFKQSTISRIGRFLGVQAVVTGSVWKTLSGTGTHGYLRFIEVESGRILFAQQVYFPNQRRFVLPVLLLDPFPTKVQADQYYFWDNLDEAMTSEKVRRVCVLPIAKVENGQFYRDQMEMGLTRLDDYKYQVLTRDKDEIQNLFNLIDNDLFFVKDRFADSLRSSQFRKTKSSVSEASMLRSKKQKFDMSDLVDPNTAARIGKMIGTEAVVLFKQFEKDSVKFQIIHTESARILFKGIGEKDNSRNYAVWRED